MDLLGSISVFGEKGEPDKISVVEERQVKQQQKYIASIKRHPGQQLFKYSMKTQKTTIVTDEDMDIKIGLDGKIEKKLVMDKYSVFVTAINHKNAVKKILRMINSI